MASTLGLNCKLYRNTGSYSSPTWTEITNVRDLTLDLSRGTADVTTRGASGFRLQVGTLAEGKVSFEMIADPADVHFAAFKTAFLANAGVDLAVTDAPIATTGTSYFRAKFSVTNFSISQPLEDAEKVSVELTPTYDTVQTPGYFTTP